MIPDENEEIEPLHNFFICVVFKNGDVKKVAIRLTRSEMSAAMVHARDGGYLLVENSSGNFSWFVNCTEVLEMDISVEEKAPCS